MDKHMQFVNNEGIECNFISKSYKDEYKNYEIGLESFYV